MVKLRESGADAGGASDQTRRRFLTMATTGVSAAGVVGVAVPFMASWNPSEKLRQLARR